MSMKKKYFVVVKQTEYVEYLVEASTEEEAIDNYRDGDYIDGFHRGGDSSEIVRAYEDK